ncbi:MAG TPA: hypothetical protein VLT13_07440 [Bacteroidota bacterium]|nr:hypothetical protein [Bacteroidota bacterium]
MKRTCFLLVMLLITSVIGAWAQIPRLLSYQGMLLGTNQQPVADGKYAVVFTLYDDAGTTVWTETHTQMPVGGGMFNVALGSVNPFSIPFDKPYFLGIKVGSDPEMTPRVPLMSAPYAIRAEEAIKLLGYHVSSTPEPNKLLPLDASGKFPASVLPGGTGGDDYIKKNTPDTTRATSTSPILLATNLGDGDGLNGRSTNGVGVSGRSTNSDGVSGWTNASDKSGVYGWSTEGRGVTGRSDKHDGVSGWTDAAGKSGVFGHTTAADAIGVHGLAGVTSGVGVYGFNNVTGNYAKLGTETYGLDVHGLSRFVLSTGQVNVSTPGGYPGLICFAPNSHRRDVIFWDTGMSFEVSSTSAAPTEGNGLTIRENGYVGIGTVTPDQKLRVMGTVKCETLTLTGGGDIAEPFDVDPASSVRPGMILAIDPAVPGKLKVADRAYDSRVAGVVSGAGGVVPGVLMSQEGSVADGKYPVALTGRVYCLADASDGAIRAGDLLTTSDLPGHAMKVTDRSRAYGAILGKAMSGLDDGQGLVLVLVTLQ